MKSVKLTLGGKPYKIFHVDGQEKEIETQIIEIWDNNCYEDGRREKNAIYLDIGANVGLSVLYFLPFAKVIYALEPNPYFFECLEKNVGKYDNVKLFNCGIDFRECQRFLFSNISEEMAQTTDLEGGSTYAVSCRLKALDEFLIDNKIDHVDVMKIDVEGEEYTILPSESFGRATSKINFIIGESHFQLGRGFPDAIPFVLEEWGYKTKWWKPKDPRFKNYFQVMNFFEPASGRQRAYRVGYNTIFYAEK